MVFFLIFQIFITIIQISKSLTPNWNFSNSAINLLLDSIEYSYNLYNGNWSDKNLKYVKNITKNQNLKEENILYINEKQIGKPNWDNIESFYFFDGFYYICPTGQNYINKYDNYSLSPIKPNDELNRDWDLKCYYISHGHWLFTFHLNLNHPGKFYGYKINNKEFKNIESIKNGIFDFIWTINNESEFYNLTGVLLSDKKFVLQRIKMKIEESALNGIEGPSKDLNQVSNILRANFSKDNYLYWITYNETYFISGYSEEKIDYSMDVSKLIFISNLILPFEFINFTKIKSIDFIRGTKYVYYEIEENKNIYHGIIDIRKNLVLFNTNETIKNIRFHTTNSLLIITEKSAFKLCLFAKDNNNKCLDSCPSGEELILDAEKYNYCGNKIGKYCNHYILKPNDICVPSCDSNIFFIEDNYICGLCRDISNYTFKYYNENTCYEKMPENAEYLYEKLKIFKCKEGFKFENGNCNKIHDCYKTCESCKEKSEDEKEQKCTSCKDSNKLLQEDKGNCIDKCLDGYYQNQKSCKNCHSDCENCKEAFSEDSSHCSSCKNNKLLQEDKGNCVNKCLDGYYQDQKSCKNCHSDCETCNKGFSKDSSHCSSCKDSNKLLQEDKGNCIDKCLNGYYQKNKSCKNCHSDCETCNEGFSKDSSHCSSCKNNKLLQEDKGNCVNKCLNGYYQDNTLCKNCHSDCETCNKGSSKDSSHCITCKNSKLLVNDTENCIDKCDISYYQKNNVCFKCNSNCKTCSQGSKNNNNYCTSCNQNSVYKYLVNSSKIGFNCVEKCPNNTILNETIYQCLDIEENSNKIFWIFVLIFLIFFSIFVVFYIYYMCKPPINSDDILNNYKKKGINQLFEMNDKEEEEKIMN